MTTALPTARPHEVGLSAARLARLGDAFKAAIERGRLPGAVALIARRGRIAYFDGFGVRDPASGTAMTNDTIFRIYSMTKPIVSVAAMMLAEEGKLLLADPISKYLPEFAAPKVVFEIKKPAYGRNGLEFEPAERPITVQDLLRHTSGITYEHQVTGAMQELYREAKVTRRDQTSAELAKRLATLPLCFQPGTRWKYGHSTDLLGRILEVITGKTLSQALPAMVLEPLGMSDTAFFVAAPQRQRLAEPFAKDPDTGAPVTVLAVKEPPQFESGGGGLVSTASDYARFLAMLANGGALDGARLLGRKTVALMSSDHLGDAAGEPPLLPVGYGFGLGFAVRRQAGLANFPGSKGDYFWNGAGGTAFWIDPEEQLFALLMTQGPNQREWSRLLFRNLVYAAIED